MKANVSFKTWWAAFGLALLLALPVSNAAAAQTESAAAAQQVVQQAARQLLGKLQQTPKQKLHDPAVIHALIDHYILPIVDMKTMSMLVLGHYWRTATPQQREAFETQFKQLMIRTYGKTLTLYPNAKFEFQPNRDTVQGQFASVYSRVIPPGQQPVTVIYQLYRHDGQWKVYDVVIDGISLVQSYRSTFAPEIQQSGLQSLIQRLSRQNQALAGGG